MAKRRRNPKRARLTPADEGNLAGRAEGIDGLATLIKNSVYLSDMIMQNVFRAREHGMSWVQIRKAVQKGVNQAIRQIHRVERK